LSDVEFRMAGSTLDSRGSLLKSNESKTQIST